MMWVVVGERIGLGSGFHHHDDDDEEARGSGLGGRWGMYYGTWLKYRSVELGGGLQRVSGALIIEVILSTPYTVRVYCHDVYS